MAHKIKLAKDTSNQHATLMCWYELHIGGGIVQFRSDKFVTAKEEEKLHDYHLRVVRGGKSLLERCIPVLEPHIPAIIEKLKAHLAQPVTTQFSYNSNNTFMVIKAPIFNNKSNTSKMAKSKSASATTADKKSKAVKPAPVAKAAKAVGPKVESKATTIRNMISSNADITIVEVIAKLAEKGIACRRSEVISAANKLAEAETAE